MTSLVVKNFSTVLGILGALEIEPIGYHLTFSTWLRFTAGSRKTLGPSVTKK